jgi:hypothetical protein
MHGVCFRGANIRSDNGGTPKALSPVAVTWTCDAQQEMLNLRLVNTFGKDITAYSITISLPIR